MREFQEQGQEIMPIKNNEEKKRHVIWKTYATKIAPTNKETPMSRTMPTIRTILMNEGKLSLRGQMRPWLLLHNKSKHYKDKFKTCNKEL